MPTIEAKHAGSCTACGQSIVVGESIDYTLQTGARHLACVDLPATLRRNAYRMCCRRCGCTLKKGEGVLAVGEKRKGDGFKRQYEAECVDVARCSERMTGALTRAARGRRHF
jgi:hypothetical protein